MALPKGSVANLGCLVGGAKDRVGSITDIAINEHQERQHKHCQQC
jgi:hypothetical protein